MGVAGTLDAVGFLGAVASLIVRFFGARGLERQQLRWFVYATVVGFAVLLLPSLLPSRFPMPDRGEAGNFAWTLAPASLSAALAVLRYRLYDIDRTINRTLVYGLVTAVLGLGYAGVVLVLGQLFGGVTRDPPTWAVAGATLAVAALFQPARRRIQQVVDRRFNRRATTPPGPLRPSGPACESRSTYTHFRLSWWPWSATPWSRQQCRCGYDRPWSAPGVSLLDGYQPVAQRRAEQVAGGRQTWGNAARRACGRVECAGGGDSASRQSRLRRRLASLWVARAGGATA